MADQELTPALLREDAVGFRLASDIYAGAEFAGMAARAAAALEEQAARMEQGERVEALVRQMRSLVCCIEDAGFIGDEEVILNNRREADRLVAAIVTACGGRVVLGDEEGGR